MISFNQGNESFSLPSNSDCISEAFEMKTESDSISSNKYKYPTISPTESMKNRQLPFFDYEKKINYSSYTEAEINESDIRRLYYIDNSKKTSKKFVVEPEKSKNIKNIRRGRKKVKIGNKKIHDKYVVDNLLRKIQVHFLSFIISFLNDILKHLNYKQRFYKLDYKYKRNINKEFVQSLKKKDIEGIICNSISSKYKKDKDSNSFICKQIKENKLLNNILSENYLKLFKKFYYTSCKKVNLREYGLDKDITLSNGVKMFKDLLKNNESEEENKEYKQLINQCVNENYIVN